VPTESQHRKQAQQNLAFAKSFDLITTPYIDWVVTAYFYAALHLVDALLARKENIHPEKHEIRRGYVRDKSYLCGIKTEYFTLKDRSEDARYRMITTYTSTKVNNEIIPLYDEIARHITQQLP
jgi:uncharacterized protein (UPF0332 family)